MKKIRNIVENAYFYLAFGILSTCFGLLTLLRSGEYQIYWGFPIYNSTGYLWIGFGVLQIFIYLFLLRKLKENPEIVLICPQCKKRFFRDELEKNICNSCNVQVEDVEVFKKKNPDYVLDCKTTPMIESMSSSDQFELEFIYRNKKSFLLCTILILLWIVLVCIF